MTGLAKKIKNKRLSCQLDLDRKSMIVTVSQLLKENPEATIILYNKQGDIIGMSNKDNNISKTIKSICQKAGGSGGGRDNLGQGKADPLKLKSLLDG